MRFITLEQGPHDPIILLHASRAQKRHKELEADKTFSICAIFAIYALLGGVKMIAEKMTQWKKWISRDVKLVTCRREVITSPPPTGVPARQP